MAGLTLKPNQYEPTRVAIRGRLADCEAWLYRIMEVNDIDTLLEMTVSAERYSDEAKGCGDKIHGSLIAMGMIGFLRMALQKLDDLIAADEVDSANDRKDS